VFTHSYAFGTSVSVVDVIVNDVNHNPILEGAQIYAQDLIDGLQERFSEEGRSILASFDSCIWNICQMMRRNCNEYEDEYGNDELEILTSHLGVRINAFMCVV